MSQSLARHSLRVFVVLVLLISGQVGVMHSALGLSCRRGTMARGVAELVRHSAAATNGQHSDTPSDAPTPVVASPGCGAGSALPMRVAPASDHVSSVAELPAGPALARSDVVSEPPFHPPRLI